MTDKELLDHLDLLPIPPGYGWKVRESTTGRGWRLQTTTQEPNFKTVREAIRYHIDQSEKE